MLKILGDCCFADGYFDKGCSVGTAIMSGNNPFEYLKINDNDFWIGNFECACAKEDQNHFVVSPNSLSAIKHLNFYCFANNHAMQIGDTGYNQTIAYFENNGIPYCGSIEKKSEKINHQGKTVGIFAFSMRPDNFSNNPLYWHLPELSDIEREIDKLSDCDYKIAFVHWGYEFMNRPNIEQRQLAHFLIDKGVDLVAGMHPHVAQGAEVYKGKHIFYSLGNAVFNMAWEPTKYGLIVNIDFSKESPVVSSDYIQIGEDYFPKIVESIPQPYSREYLDSLINYTKENEIYFAETRKFAKQYTKANRKAIVKRMLIMSNKEKVALITDFLKRRIFHK